jgi:hypothetical protein
MRSFPENLSGHRILNLSLAGLFLLNLQKPLWPLVPGAVRHGGKRVCTGVYFSRVNSVCIRIGVGVSLSGATGNEKWPL